MSMMNNFLPRQFLTLFYIISGYMITKVNYNELYEGEDRSGFPPESPPSNDPINLGLDIKQTLA